MMPKRSLIYGIGVNDLSIVNNKDHFYDTWFNVVKKCNNQSYKVKCQYFQDSFLSNDWVKFSSFKKWMLRQEWSNRIINHRIIDPYNNEFSSDKCCFIPKELTYLFRERHNPKPNGMPYGIFKTPENKFMIRFYYKGESLYLGIYESFIQAQILCKTFRIEEMKKTLPLFNEKRIKDGINYHIHLLDEEIKLLK